MLRDELEGQKNISNFYDKNNEDYMNDENEKNEENKSPTLFDN
ncbi:1910_t:CDS:2 [Funneliformis geosporum]|uniref:1910_t:CDS:1 n=1 Tax=Funneliformis geosporum TaxID=1117311 RepID=A0A9W4SN27_9GLOM|nr:1910_t:CDS:2 [Funneliformis geosporum]